MPNPTDFITPEELFAKGGDSRTLEELQRLSRRNGVKCSVCGQPEWKLGGCGLCFSCTTGESDPSGDYELIPS